MHAYRVDGDETLSASVHFVHIQQIHFISVAPCADPISAGKGGIGIARVWIAIGVADIHGDVALAWRNRMGHAATASAVEARRLQDQHLMPPLAQFTTRAYYTPECLYWESRASDGPNASASLAPP